MNTNWVNRLPQETGEAMGMDEMIWGIIPVRIVVVQRIEGWCAYAWPKYLPDEYANYYGRTPSFESVLSNGDKMPKRAAREMFPGMEGPYAR